MRLFEITTPRLFLCTTTKQAIGATLSADEPVALLSEELENILERERPSSALPRKKSIPLATIPTGTDFTYVIEVRGRLERQHTGWLKQLAEADPLQEGVRRHFANGYWSGAECREEYREPWAYRAEAVRVLSRMGRSSRDV